jgi:hypothetical protein
MDGGQLKNVCLSVACCLCVCHEFVPNYLVNRWSDWAKFFFTKTRENVYLRILILKFRGQDPRVNSGAKSTLSYNFCTILTKSIFFQR